MNNKKPKQHDIWNTTNGLKVYITNDGNGGHLQLSYKNDTTGWVAIPLKIKELNKRLSKKALVQNFAAYDTSEYIKKLAQIRNQ